MRNRNNNNKEKLNRREREEEEAGRQRGGKEDERNCGRWSNRRFCSNDRKKTEMNNKLKKLS